MAKSVGKTIRNIAHMLLFPFQLAYYIVAGVIKFILRWVLELLKAVVYPIRHLKCLLQTTKANPSPDVMPAHSPSALKPAQALTVENVSSMLHEALANHMAQFEIKLQSSHQETRRIMQRLLQQSVKQVTTPPRLPQTGQPIVMSTTPHAPKTPFPISADTLLAASAKRVPLNRSPRDTFLKSFNLNRQNNFLAAALKNRFESVHSPLAIREQEDPSQSMSLVD